MRKETETSRLYECRTSYLEELFECKYPWEILPKIGDYAKKLTESGIDGFTLLSDGVLVGENVKIHPTATVIAPAVIGSGSEIRPGAYIRGNVITGENCVIGNSTEIKNAVLLDNVQIPHYNYVGDSVLGNRSHMGAGSICSNLKSDKRNVVIRGESDYETHLKKVGGFLGDGADVGSGCILNPGTVIGKNTSVYPLTALRGVYPENCIVKSQNEIAKRE